MYHPSKEEFIKLSQKGNLIPVYKEIVAGKETPASAFRKIEGKYSFLLESIEGGENIARYSFLGTVPSKLAYKLQSFKEIRKLLGQFRPVAIEALPRFHGGLVGYIAYDMVRQIENIPDKNPNDLKLPPIFLMLTDTCLAFDHVEKKILIISNAHVKNNPEKSYDEACRQIETLEGKLRKPVDSSSQKSKVVPTTEFKSNLSKPQFEEMVRRCKEHIRAGDIIQGVLSQRFETKYEGDPFNVYCVLRSINPSPYMFYLKFGDLKIAGSSPEVMVRLEGGEATLRPIAGTRRRGKDKEEDKKLARELLASEKEKAEHIMLVDLGRNDLGRVCEFGTVKLTEQMVIEKYSHVMHIVSNVLGKLKKDKDAVDLLSATFPAGTVSGAPKVRAMEIIDELENVKRGPYAGCVGYFGFSGEFDTGITIRTIVFKGKRALVQAGAGIVADSIPEQEYTETVNKARGMLRAIELAQ